jgi:hypothetical protein
MPFDVFLIRISKSSKSNHSHDDRVLLEMLPQKRRQDPWCMLRSDSQRFEKERTCRTRREVLETSALVHMARIAELFGQTSKKTAMILTTSEFQSVSAETHRSGMLTSQNQVFESPEEEQIYGRKVKILTEGPRSHIIHLAVDFELSFS